MLTYRELRKVCAGREQDMANKNDALAAFNREYPKFVGLDGTARWGNVSHYDSRFNIPAMPIGRAVHEYMHDHRITNEEFKVIFYPQWDDTQERKEARWSLGFTILSRDRQARRIYGVI